MQESFAKLFQSSHLGAVIAISEQIIDANDAFLRMIGYTREELQEAPIYWKKMTPPSSRNWIAKQTSNYEPSASRFLTRRPAPRHDKYFLRDLHQEIGLYDRKLAYLEQCAEFASPADREEAEKRLLAKRAPLQKTALELAALGVEYEERDIPRSLRAINLEHDGKRKNLTLVKRSQRKAATQTVADGDSLK